MEAVHAAADPCGGCCEGTRGRAVRAESKVSLITWGYVWRLFLSLEAVGLMRGTTRLLPPKC